MIRVCPNCLTERPLTEFYCEGTRDDLPCHWDLSGVDIGDPGGTQPPSPPGPTPIVPLVCPNGHAVGEGNLICPVCETPISGELLPPPPAPCQEPTPGMEPTVIDGWRLNVRLPVSTPVRERFIAVRESDGRRAELTLYAEGSEPDPAVTKPSASCLATASRRSSRQADGTTAHSRLRKN
jgi:primosomal replication protein N''